MSMKLVSILAPLALAVTATSALAQPAIKPAPPKTYEVAAIRAFLYFHGTGTLGDEDIAAGDVWLRNANTGGGDIEAPVAAVLVKVDVRGPSFLRAPAKLVIEAKADKRRLSKQTLSLGDFFDEDAGVTLPVIVTGVGCETVTITATLTGKGIKSTRTAELPFQCGE
jgi:hypothetical protein